MSFSQRLRRLCLWLLAGFIVLFLLRLCYGYVAVPDARTDRAQTGAPETLFASDSGYEKKNYASEKYSVSTSGASGQVDQKYEKTATVQSRTKDFAADEKKARAAITAFSGIIQFESGRGTSGNRALTLHIGIQPAKFDDFYAEVQTIGTVSSLSVSKTDKTNEFLALKAKRASLEKNRAALMELKSRDGKIEELMSLQQQILNIETELQNLGVQLGEFDEVNAFCTVKFALMEDRTLAAGSIGLLHRTKVALYWTMGVYGGIVGLLFLTMLAAFFILLTVDRLGLIRTVVAQMQKPEKEA